MEGLQLEIKPIEYGKREDAIELIRAVFLKYEAPDYSPMGIETFKKTAIENRAFMDALTMYGAFQGERLIGVIATRNCGNHIALFFVDGNHHRQGVGRMLFQEVAANSTADEITVNSSPFAVEVYHHLGFIDTSPEQIVNGIRFTPMKFIK
jgi:GNAT superfamily N-acetyltransferase